MCVDRLMGSVDLVRRERERDWVDVDAEGSGMDGEMEVGKWRLGGWMDGWVDGWMDGYGLGVCLVVVEEELELE